MEKLGLNMRFGDFEADFRTQELRKQGVRVKLPRQSFQILQKLLERPGELVTRDELHQALWPGDTFVDFDHGVNNSVKRIRDALGDSPDAPRYIETLPRLGYRFVGSIDEVPVVPVPVVSSAAREEVGRPARWRWRFFLLVLALALVLAGIARQWFFLRVKESVPVMEVVPLTGVIGKQNLASFSPDGSQVTFTLTNDPKRGNGLYTALVGGDTLLQLTDDPRDCCSAWSPDGQAVAFSRNSEEEFNIYTVSPLGGTPRKLYARSRRGLYHYSTNRAQLLAWSPDGKLVAFSEANAEGRSAITLLSLAEHSTRRLTSPPVEHIDSQPAFSPDGKTMAFVRTSGPGAVDDLFLVPIEGGVPRRLSFDNREIYGPPAWTEDGRHLIFSSARAGLQSLWRLPAAGGDPRAEAEASTSAYYPAISTKAHRLAYTRRINNNNIWQLTLKDRRGLLLIPSSRLMGPRSHSNPTVPDTRKSGSATGMAPIQRRLLPWPVMRARRVGRQTAVPSRSTSGPKSTAKSTWLKFPLARPGRSRRCPEPTMWSPAGRGTASGSISLQEAGEKTSKCGKYPSRAGLLCR